MVTPSACGDLVEELGEPLLGPFEDGVVGVAEIDGELGSSCHHVDQVRVAGSSAPTVPT